MAVYSTPQTSLKNALVFITGASSGIGEACAWAFARAGARLLLCARRLEKLEQLAEKVHRELPECPIYNFELDVRNRQKVSSSIQALAPEWKAIDVLINNAGLSRGLEKLHLGQVDDWEEMIDTNVKGLLYISRQVIPDMVARGKGHVINIGSIAGHETYPGGNVYCASKYAVRALTDGLRMDLVDTPLRVSSIDPGMVETEFSKVRFHGDDTRAKQVYQGLQPLSADDVANAIVWTASLPPHVQMAEMLLLPTAQASALVNYRQK